jgi:hypothetical protein
MGPVPFPDFDDLPDPAALWQALKVQGCLLLRQILPPEPLARWRQTLHHCYEQADALFERGALSPEIYQRFCQFGHLPPGLWQGHQDFFETVLLEPRLQPVLRALFPHGLHVLSQFSRPRRQSARWPERRIPFHQDAEFLPEPQALNFWIPLDPCGRTAPGLELLCQPQSVCWFTLADLTQPLSQQRDDQYVHSLYAPELFWRPVLEPGDLLVFNALLLHRTWLTAGMQQARFSLELRVFAARESPF